MYWRVTLCFVVVCLLSAFVTRSTEWLSFSQGFAFALSGFVLGIALEERADRVARQRKGLPPRKPRITSALTARLTAVVIGAVWGLVSGAVGKPAISGFILLASGGVLWFWYCAISTARMSTHEAILRLALAAFAHIAAVVAISMIGSSP
ncbi:MAG: hypothetical protein LBU45_07690 [Azoarcus sp.]|nr:hypothetical protein [Azoarcus sp.]